MDNSQSTLFDLSDPAGTPVYKASDFPFYFGAQSMADQRFIAEDWVPVLEPLDQLLAGIAEELARRSAAGEHLLPAPEVMFRALQLPLAEVRVVAIGQDPYPTVGHAIGLAFAADAAVRPLPRSLANIYKELEADLGIAKAAHADLSSWHRQGVLLLNQALSVAAGNAGAHLKIGWTQVIEAVVAALNERPNPPVALLWGKHAQKMAGLMDRMPQLASAHPSPLSASRGFFGSKPFSKINRLLAEAGEQPIDWKIPQA
ncbi:uracil-DNA glycosylase [Glutamicibacter uratoxydans]|nr:uracil-DNA glycosylase [Glutamicibacter uratoxydans]